MAGNTGQYMISDAAPEAPDFANGLFLTSANLGTTVGTALCGLFIAGFGRAARCWAHCSFPPQASDRSSPGTEPEN